jgi:hypothetical protein
MGRPAMTAAGGINGLSHCRRLGQLYACWGCNHVTRVRGEPWAPLTCTCLGLSDFQLRHVDSDTRSISIFNFLRSSKVSSVNFIVTAEFAFNSFKSQSK